MSGNKTRPTATDPAAFLDTVTPERRRADGFALLDLFRAVTGFEPKMWGPSLIGFGRYSYTYASGRSGEFLATGFSPRKANLSVHIMPGYADYGDILSRLGKHRMGKSCLYIARLSDIDTDVLAELIRAGLDDLGRTWPVHPA